MNLEPIFIVGAPRSGTTLLAAMLGAHSRLSCGPETHFFRWLSKADENMLCNEETWPAAAADFLASITYRDFDSSLRKPLIYKYHLDEEVIVRFLEKREPGVANLLAAITIPYMERMGKSRWIEKTPDHLEYVRLMRQHFPKSIIIRIGRDPRDVSLSLTKVPWGSRSLIDGIHYWRHLDDVSADFFTDDNQSYSLRYEDLVRSPRDELTDLCDFLGEEFEEGMFDTSNTGIEVNFRNVPWKDMASKPLDSSRIAVWRHEMSKQENIMAEAMVGDRIERYEYPREIGFDRLGELFPSQQIATKYPDAFISSLPEGVRFWKIDASEKPKVKIFIGDPDLDNWLGEKRFERVKNTVSISGGIARSYLDSTAVYWIQGQHDNLSVSRPSILNRFLRYCLPGSASDTSRAYAGRRLTILIAALLALTGTIAMMIITRWGIGTSPDSAAYIATARNFSEIYSIGTFRGLLYPGVLAIISVFDVDPLVGARWINSILFGANIILLAVMVGSFNPKAWWLAPVTALFALVSGVLLNVHAYAWSESLFIFLLLISLGFLALFLKRWQWLFLVLAALMTALATLTRYAGLALVATGVLGILLFARNPVRRRLLRAGIYGLLSVAPMIVWLSMNVVTSDSAPRALAFHPIGRSQVWQAIFTITDWINVPSALPGVARLVVVILFSIGITAILLLRNRGKEEKLAGAGVSTILYLVKLFALFLLVFGMFLVVSISFFDANTPLDDRILSPVYPISLGIVMYAASELLGQARGATGTAALAVLGLLFLIPTLISSTSWSRNAYRQGLGFSSRDWQNSALIHEVRELPADVPIVSNRPEPIYLLADRSAIRLPKEYEAVTQQTNPDYQEELNELAEQLKLQDGVLVYFHEPNQLANEDEITLMEQLSLKFQTRFDDGAIYRTERVSQ